MKLKFEPHTTKEIYDAALVYRNQSGLRITEEDVGDMATIAKDVSDVMNGTMDLDAAKQRIAISQARMKLRQKLRRALYTPLA